MKQLIYNKVESVLDLPFVGMEVITVRDTGDRLIHELVTWTDQEQKYYKMNNIVAWAAFNKFIIEGAKNTEQQVHADEPSEWPDGYRSHGDMIENVLNALITREYPEDMGAITIYGDGIPALAARLRAAALDEIVAMDHASTAYWQIVADVLGVMITGDNNGVCWWKGEVAPEVDQGIWVSSDTPYGSRLLGEWTEGEPKTRIVRPKEGLTR